MKAKKFYLAALIVLVSLFAFTLTASASSGALQDTPTVPDLRGFLQWLVGGGGSILAVSWLLERMAWFQNLTGDQKKYTVFGISGAIGCAALAVITYVPAAVLDAISPYFLILATIFASVFLIEAFHKADKQ